MIPTTMTLLLIPRVRAATAGSGRGPACRARTRGRREDEPHEVLHFLLHLRQRADLVLEPLPFLERIDRDALVKSMVSTSLPSYRSAMISRNRDGTLTRPLESTLCSKLPRNISRPFPPFPTYTTIAPSIISQAFCQQKYLFISRLCGGGRPSDQNNAFSVTTRAEIGSIDDVGRCKMREQLTAEASDRRHERLFHHC